MLNVVSLAKNSMSNIFLELEKNVEIRIKNFLRTYDRNSDAFANVTY